MRCALVGLFVLSGMPLITAVGMPLALVLVAIGFVQFFEGDVVGVANVCIGAFAFFGLMTLWSLARHYWTEPNRNPAQPDIRRNIIGLAMGLLALPGLFVEAVMSGEETLLAGGAAGLLALPAAIFFVAVLLFNWSATRRANKQLQRTVTDKAPSHIPQSAAAELRR